MQRMLASAKVTLAMKRAKGQSSGTIVEQLNSYIKQHNFINQLLLCTQCLRYCVAGM